VLGVDLHDGCPEPGDLGPLSIPVEKQVVCSPPDTLGRRIRCTCRRLMCAVPGSGPSAQRIDDPDEGIAAGERGFSRQDRRPTESVSDLA
jgi:hypothetical protein